MRIHSTRHALATATLALAAALGTIAAVATPATAAVASTPTVTAPASSTGHTVPVGTAGHTATPTPPMGWNSYNAYACDNGAKNMDAVGRFIHDSGLQADGYTTVNSDGCYDDLEGLGSPNTYGVTAPTAQDAENCGAVNGRLPDGEIAVNPYAFPASSPCANDGFALVGDTLHSLGLKLGLYLDASNNWNCEEIPGSYGFDDIDAATLSTWGADFVKLDWGCDDTTEAPGSNAPAGYTGIDAAPGNQGFGGPTFATNPAYVTDQQHTQIAMYTALVNAIRAQKRPITVSIAGAGTTDSASWGLPIADMDRPTGDANANFTATGRHAAGSVVGIVNADAENYASLSKPGHWIDPDAMEVGNGTMTPAEDRSEMSMFSEMAQPLLMSTNLCPRDCGPDTTPATQAQLDLATSVFGNKRVIAVDQDSLGAPAHIVGSFDGTHLEMARPLANGDVAVTLFNESTTDAATMSATASQLGLRAAAAYRVQDLWSGATTTTSTGSISATVPATGTVMYRITPVGPAAHATPSPTPPSPTPPSSTVSASRASAIHPTPGRPAPVRSADIPSGLQSVSCPTAVRCVAVDQFGSALTFAPAHPAAATKLTVDPGHTLVSVSCPAEASTCVALDDRGTAVVFPATGRGPISRLPLDQTGQPTAVDCVSLRQCTVVDGVGAAITFDAARGRVLNRASVDPHVYLAAVSCPTASQCSAAGGGGNGGDTEVTFDPRTGNVGPAGVSSLDAVTVNGVSSVSCPSTAECTVVDGSGGEVSFVPQTGAPLASGVVALEGADLPAGLGVMTSVDCISATQCTAVDLTGRAVTYDPANGDVIAPVRQVDADAAGLRSIQCPAATECIAVDLAGRSVTFAPTAAGTGAVRTIDGAVRWKSHLAS